MRPPSLNRRLSMQREVKRRRPARLLSMRDADGQVTSVPDQKKLHCKEVAHSGPNLPEDIWCHIHALMPLRDFACSACVCRTFLYSWRCNPKLIFTEETLGLKQRKGQTNDIARDFTSRVDCILKNHSGSGVKKLKLVVFDRYNVSTCHLNSWLEKAIVPGIEEVTILLPTKYRVEYNFPCSVLLNGRGNSIRFLDLASCAFRPQAGFDCSRSLRQLHLCEVCITGDELECLISNSFSLEELKLNQCDELICLKIPFWLERLTCLSLFECRMLQVIESKAPNLSTFDFYGEPVQLSFGESSQVKNFRVDFSMGPNTFSYAITKLPSITPHLETLTLYSAYERVNTPIVADKFLHLKYLMIYLTYGDEACVPPSYDYLSLASFLNASPVLETFILSVDQKEMKHDSAFGDASPKRQISEHKLDRLKKVQINGFCSAKSMVELTCHILENATSLESVTLDTIHDVYEGGNTVRCWGRKSGKCWPQSRHMILEGHKTISVIKRDILGRVPSTVKLNIREPCTRCHAIDAKLL
ncbi:hypothetical protein ACP4OV_026143 [Aristida adscensionis]